MRRFLITGCQRSGTTLLRLVLGSHSQIYCYDEYLAYARLRDGDASEAQGYQLVGYKIPRWAEQLNDPVLSDEGLDVAANHFYAGEPIIFMIRDVRDVVVSMASLMLKADDGEVSWLDSWGMRILAAKSRNLAFRERYRRELELASRDRYAVGALYWRFKTEAYFQYMHLGWPVLALKYEQLTIEPESEFRKVVKFLRVEWESNLLHHFQFRHPEVDAYGKAPGNTDPKRPIDQTSVGQWRQKLSPAAIDSIMWVAGDLNNRLYESFTRRLIRFVSNLRRR